MDIGVAATIPTVLGLVGWQWVYIAWGIPAVVLGFMVLVLLTDRPAPGQLARAEEREALEAELEREKAEHQAAAGHMTVLPGAAPTPRCSLLAAAYFFVVTGNYGVEFFMPCILKDWYTLDARARSPG